MTTATATGDTITLTIRDWSETFPAARLPAKLAFYRGLRDRGARPGQPGPHAAHYAPTVAALEALCPKGSRP